jgi:hypothetical protein
MSAAGLNPAAGHPGRAPVRGAKMKKGPEGPFFIRVSRDCLSLLQLQAATQVTTVGLFDHPDRPGAAILGVIDSGCGLAS